jgi:hypothetical protein
MLLESAHHSPSSFCLIERGNALRVIHLVLALAVCVGSDSLLAQGNAPYKDPAALAVAQRSLSALGSNRIPAGQTFAVEGNITLVGQTKQTFSVVIKSRGASQMRTEITTPKGLRVFVVNNGHGFIRQPDGEIKWLADENMQTQRITHIPALSILSEYLSPKSKVDFVGTSSVDGISADVISLGVYSGSDAKAAEEQARKTRVLIYLDKITGLVLRLQQLNYGEDVRSDTQQFETRYSDYRSVNGVMIPFHQQTLADGRLLQEFVIDSATFGTPVTDSDFALTK